MKHLLSSLMIICLSLSAISQTVVYHETFESTPLQVVNYGSPSQYWTVNNTLHNSGSKSYHVNPSYNNQVPSFRTNTFSTLGQNFVKLEFYHICNLQGSSGAIIEVSVDSGVSWVNISDYYYYGLSENYGFLGNSFNTNSYTNWVRSYPDNSWWKKETFDITHIAANKENVCIKFSFGFGANNSIYYGWFVDDIKVTQHTSDFIPPRIRDLTKLSGNIYSSAPFQIKAKINDYSGLDIALLNYRINGVIQPPISMTVYNADTLTATLPALNIGDTVCYSIYARDASPNLNSNTEPSNSRCRSFIICPKATLPYYENFDSITTSWTSSLGVGPSNTKWDIGNSINPAPYSSPNCWSTNLNATYTDDANTILTSPAFDFSQAKGATLKFMHNYDTQEKYDNTKLEYTTDGITWHALGIYNDPLAINWYPSVSNYAYYNDSWSGNSNGWIESQYKLDFLDTNSGLVQFRFIFTTDDSDNNYLGYFIDDFSIIYPPTYDLELLGFLDLNDNLCFANSNNIELIIRNNGINTIDFAINPLTANANCSITNPTIFNPIIINTGTLAHGDSIIVLVSNNFDFSASGMYSFDANINCNLDITTHNDSITAYEITNNTITSLPFNEDFETFPRTALISLNGWKTEYNTYFQYLPTDTAKWSVINGPTSSNSGPSVDHTSQTSTGNYIYTNSAFGEGHDTCMLISPCINIPNSNKPIEFSFWYHMYGNGMGDLGVDVFHNGMWLNNQIFFSDLQQQSTNDPWKSDTLNLDAYKGSTIKIRFRSIKGSNSRSNMAIDDIRISEIQTIDIKIEDIIKTSNNNCNSNLETIEAVIINKGINTINFATNNMTINCENIGVNPSLIPPLVLNSGSIASGDTMSVIITNTFDMFQAGQYIFNANVSTVGDSALYNDSIENINIISYANIPLPTIIDFETTPIASIIPPLGWENISDSLTGLFSWRADNGITPTLNTGPRIDHTLGNDLGMYFYFETSVVSQNHTGILQSNCINFMNIANPHLKFWYHMYGSTTGSLHVDVLINDTWIEDVYLLNGQQHSSTDDPWSLATVDLSAYSNQIIKIRFRGIKGTGSKGDMAIDDIEIYNSISYDIGVTEIINPLDLGIEDSYSDINVVVQNFGDSTINNFNVIITHNSSNHTVQNFTNSLAPNQIATLTLSGFNLLDGLNEICATTSLIDDFNTYNDSLCKNYFGLPKATLYENDFETSTNPLIPSYGSEWEWGTPDGDIINYAFSGTKSWMTDLDGPYVNSSNTFLTIPQTFDFSNISGAYISLYHWNQSERAKDGANIEYSTDNGNSWEILGDINDSLGVNWYNNICTGGRGWSGYENNWRSSVYNLSLFDNSNLPIQFRITFKSDFYAEQYDGFAIDNFAINIPMANVDIGVVEFINPPTNTTVAGSTQDVTIRIENFGLNIINSLTVKYIDYNGQIISELWSGLLLPNNTIDYTFNTPYTAPNYDYNLIALTYETNDFYTFNDTLKQDMQVITGIKEKYIASFTIGNCSPNPVLNNASIPVKIEQSGIVNFVIYNSLGQIVYTNKYSLTAGENQIGFNTENLASGVYSYGISFNNNTQYSRFSKN